eukprot:scaffold82980_cov12-Tisochrysis_lutea.AAC.1
MLFCSRCTQNDACYLSCDGGRVCRPLIICDKGVPRVKQEHITNLMSGACKFWKQQQNKTISRLGLSFTTR